ncbi:FlaA1/EpsC-like NDP-sugar epimerase [Anoxybacillus calidus]|jgi:hypothetical protein|uniref:FlaA1/EpsC-like NDP-sugar epimerase n=1 Tax=[Anoxybacillus] calidus TaxID=575178 RepID=A0A7W0BX07_9BACL|nr:hypothetical protein [Anoxybacillus calidus]MBA2871554.1 FlaA1/EpsC-like NDP-sugar epimerase [Anoxybacillus calidus]
MINLLQLKSRSLGWLLYLPMAIFVAMLFFIFGIPNNNVNVVIVLLQLTFIPLVCIWTLYLFYDLLGTGNFQYMWLYYKTNIEKILIMFFVVLFIPLISLIIAIEFRFDEFQTLPILMLLFTQCLISAVVSLILFAVFGDVSIPITLIFLYISAELATFGSSKYLYHIFFLNLQESLNFTNTISLALLNLLFGLVGYKIFKLLIT